MNRNLFLFSVCWALLLVGLGWVAQLIAISSFTFVILGSVAVATWAIYFLMMKTDAENRVKNYLLSIVLKLLAGGIFISVLIVLDKPHADTNAIFFMITYFLFTTLEVAFLPKHFR